MEKKDLLDKIKEIYKISTEGSITKDELISVLFGLKNFLSNYRLDLERENSNLIGDLKSFVNTSISQSNIDVDNIKDELNKIVQKLDSIVIKDGIDGYTPEKGIDYLTEPEIKELEDRILEKVPSESGEVIVEKINSLPIKDSEFKIDASHIKNLPKMVQNQMGGVVARNIYQMGDVSLTSLSNNQSLKWDDTNKRWVNYTPSSGGTVGPGTINEIAYFDTTTSIASLTTATYPSLTELSYVKGVTSGIQAQIDALGSVTWDTIGSPAGDQALTFAVGETSAWTNQNTTESLLTMSTSTLTTGNQLSLVSTSTALASGNEQLNISVSGVNATNGITVTGQTISVTNTNATSGTNIGLEITSSGATTVNVGIKARGIGIIGNLSVANALNSFGVYSSLTVAASDSDIGIINSLRPINTVGTGTGYLMTLLNSSAARADYAYFNGLIEANTAGSHTGALAFFTATAGTLTEKWRITSAGHLNPLVDATNDIGTSTVGINDLHFGSGGVINFDGGDVTLTHSANTLAMAGGLLSVTASATNTYGLLVTGGATRESNASSGEIKLGGHATDFGYISYLGATGDMTFTNMYDAAAGDIKFVTRGSGTPVTGLTISGLGVVNPKSLQIGDGVDATASVNFRSSTNSLGYIEYSGTTMTLWTNNATRMTLSETLLTMAVPIAMGTNSITMTGSIAATGARVTKGWFTDIESTNMPTVGGTAILTSLTAPQFTTIELGHASANTLSASGGVLSIEGKAIPNLTDGGTFLADISVPDEAYGVGWNGSVEVPTKNAVYDKIETMGGGIFSAGRQVFHGDNFGATFYVDEYAGSTTETTCGNIMPITGTLKRLYIDPFDNSLNSGNGVFTIMKNGVATAVTVTIAAGSATITGDTTNTVAVTAGDRITVRGVYGGSSGALYFGFSYLVV